GDNVIFWGPLAWTVIFGLLVATFLTLIIVPVLFTISYRMKIGMRKKVNNIKSSKSASLQDAA
ncbi:hypothetical protein, partial [Zeaxanthinibacter enoshimensis]|uniref:hypothetical protein n=1 Tax=Zeaxanthinibacter enoshimensis TaxID=392009 RepID=UPI003564CE0A